jgi:hypothetical protein
MSKKTFAGGLSSLLGEQTPKTKKGRPKTSERKINIASQKGTKDGETRATIIINEELLDKIKAVAYWDRQQIKDTISNALSEYANKKKPKARPLEVRKKEQEQNQKLIKIDGNTARLPEF